MVYQDTRGRYGSEGRFVKYLSDGEDGFDTCAWLRDQTWCDGRICTMGLSYAAHTQAALACLDPPGLVAQVLDCGGFVNSWQSGIRQSGAFELKQATWAFKNALVSPEAEADPVLHAALAGEDIREWFTRMPWKPGHSPLRHHPDYEAYLFDQWTHGAFDEFWQQLGIWTAGWHERYSSAACVHMSSWWDPYPLTATGNYTGPEARGARTAALDPWAVDAWRSQRHVLRRCRVRAGCRAGCLGRRLARLSAALLRSRGEGRAARRTGGAHLRHGRRQRAAQCGGQAGAWRTLDHRRRLAAAGRAIRGVPSAWRMDGLARAAPAANAAPLSL